MVLGKFYSSYDQTYKTIFAPSWNDYIWNKYPDKDSSNLDLRVWFKALLDMDFTAIELLYSTNIEIYEDTFRQLLEEIKICLPSILRKNASLIAKWDNVASKQVFRDLVDNEFIARRQYILNVGRDLIESNFNVCFDSFHGKRVTDLPDKIRNGIGTPDCINLSDLIKQHRCVVADNDITNYQLAIRMYSRYFSVILKK